MQSQRQTAYKLWISNLIKGKFSRGEGQYGLNYVLVDDKKISRINLIGTVVDIYKNELGSYIVALLDDGSGAIRCKNWNEDCKFYDDLIIGNIVLIVGKIREQSGEIFIIPEIIRVVEPSWLKLRGLELKKKYGEPERIEFNADVKDLEIVEEIVSGGGDRQKVLDLIEKSNSEGIEYNELILKTDLNEKIFNDIVNDLLKEGEIFEPKAGRLKILG